MLTYQDEIWFIRVLFKCVLFTGHLKLDTKNIKKFALSIKMLSLSSSVSGYKNMSKDELISAINIPNPTKNNEKNIFKPKREEIKKKNTFKTKREEIKKSS